MRAGSSRPESREAGFTYVGAMLIVALIAVATLRGFEAWSATLHHQRLVEVRWILAQYRQAIASYIHSTPGGGRQRPLDWEDLLSDRRTASPRRHLRKVFVHPVPGAGWDVVRDSAGRMMGVATTFAGPGGTLSTESVAVSADHSSGAGP